jgi:hypothetical protein
VLGLVLAGEVRLAHRFASGVVLVGAGERLATRFAFSSVVGGELIDGHADVSV